MSTRIKEPVKPPDSVTKEQIREAVKKQKVSKKTKETLNKIDIKRRKVLEGLAKR